MNLYRMAARASATHSVEGVRGQSTSDSNYLPRLDVAQCGKSCWDNRCQIFDLIGSCTEHKQADLAIREVLLVLHDLIDRYKDIEFFLSQQDKRTILFSGPSHLLHSPAFMFGEEPL